MELYPELVLPSCYYVGVENGALCVVFDKANPELWFGNPRGRYKLLPRDDEDFQQLSLPLAFDFNLVEMARSYKNLFERAMELQARFKEDNQSIVTFCLRYGTPALELIEACPGLAFLVASQDFYQNRNKTNEEIFTPEKKRTQLLHLCGFPGTKSTDRLFKRIAAGECCHELFFGLKMLLHSGRKCISKVMRHMQKINLLVIDILMMEELRPYIKKSLIDEVSSLSSTDSKLNHFYALEDIKNALSGAINEGMKVRPLRRLEDVDVLHEDLTVWQYGLERFSQLERMTFPLPPLRGLETGTNRIVPISTGIELWDEGKEMHHCVAGLADDLIEAWGSRYVYHVEVLDEKATLLIGKELSGWIIDEIKGPSNAEVSEKMLSFVLSWLESSGGGHSNSP